ncbi:MAG: ABC transporter ATP-binding protein [Acidimicrobiales bacterium]
METCIRLRSLIKEYDSLTTGTVRAVDGIDLDIGSGEIVALLGPNGAGKTTTLDMILGFITPSDGEVAVFGQSPRQAVADGKVSAVLQTGGLLRDLTVGETVELVASIYRKTTGPGTDSVVEILERTGLTERATRLIKDCSGGEQQRLRFALALLADPDLLLLDEPTAGMDVEARRLFWATMEAEADRGRTIVFATHYLQEAEDFARRTVLMSGGRIVADGQTDQIRRRAAGWTVRVTVATELVDQAAAALELEADVHRVTVSGSRLTVEAADSDSVARRLLSEFGGSDLEIESASLEQAFVQLTHPADAASA